jgi:hypothetical protein
MSYGTGTDFVRRGIGGGGYMSYYGTDFVWRGTDTDLAPLGMQSSYNSLFDLLQTWTGRGLGLGSARPPPPLPCSPSPLLRPRPPTPLPRLQHMCL